MKNTFAVTTTLLLALALGGSYAGYRIATTPHEAGSAAEGTQTAGETPAAGATSPQTATNEQHSPASPSADMSGDRGTSAAAGQGGSGQPSSSSASTSGNPDSRATAPAGSNANTANANSGTLGGQMTANGTPGERSENTPQPATGNTNEVKPASPTVQGSQGTELGQTGATNTEKATAGNPAVSDSTAAAVASANAGDTAQGLKLFTANCAGCHGAQAQGGVGPALNTATGPGSWMIAQFQAAVREGHAPDRELGPVMPRFTTAQISDEDLTDIYAYLKSLVK
ncbi:cytochrome c, class I [Deinococcus geothermalis DSM 11300]|uniref:Cytochrome c, class I n=1 Tax=Deinococcus geothermalis (strain DSM 11300 / CIP 105573 / AG-3a) TaxID=319795 RepID=Q1J0M6_DEIGD|nr:cytochrome c [Deinococcus geothermalis]ABF44958.1 cytochrome c, class I [Deinococcus geothermalis DSM 11300]